MTPEPEAGVRLVTGKVERPAVVSQTDVAASNAACFQRQITVVMRWESACLLLGRSVQLYGEFGARCCFALEAGCRGHWAAHGAWPPVAARDERYWHRRGPGTSPSAPGRRGWLRGWLAACGRPGLPLPGWLAVCCVLCVCVECVCVSGCAGLSKIPYCMFLID
jgi:hypothetical protein